MRLTSEEWRKIQQAIKDGQLNKLIEKMLSDAYEKGREDGHEEANEE
jgi:hypothetical protein